jgi:DNA-binding CsgD family transcriptional regulator
MLVTEETRQLGTWHRAFMRSQTVDEERLLAASRRLGDAAVDPMIWPEIMEQVCVATRATGAVLLQSDSRTPDVPRTAGLDEYQRSSYFGDGWYARDIRAERGVPLLLQGAKVITDQDILTPEEMPRFGLYAESLIPNGLQWFAVIGFRAGSALWGLSIQRATREGPFDRHNKRVLGRLSDRLTETATLSKVVGRAVLTGMTNALELINRPAIALDRSGRVLGVNQAAETIFDDELRVRDGRLFARDRQARAALAQLVDQMRTTPDTAALPVAPIVVHRETRRPLVIRVLPVDGATRTPFLGARALLALLDLNAERRPDCAVVAQAFGLSPAETRLAALIATGLSPERAAEQLGVTRETVRTQLKAIFAKTGTSRQAELVALAGRLS